MRRFTRYDYRAAEDEIDVFGRGISLPRQAGPTGKTAEVHIVRRNIKYYFADDTWALIRMSGTEPVMRIVPRCRTAKVQKLLRRKNSSVRSMTGLFRKNTDKFASGEKFVRAKSSRFFIKPLDKENNML